MIKSGFLFLSFMLSIPAFADVCRIELSGNDRSYYDVMLDGRLNKVADSLEAAVKIRNQLVAAGKCVLDAKTPVCDPEMDTGTFHAVSTGGVVNSEPQSGGYYKILVGGQPFDTASSLDEVFSKEAYLAKNSICKPQPITCSVGPSYSYNNEFAKGTFKVSSRTRVADGYQVYGGKLIRSKQVNTEAEANTLLSEAVSKGYCSATSSDTQSFPHTELAYIKEFGNMNVTNQQAGLCSYAVEGDFALEAVDINMPCEIGNKIDIWSSPVIIELGGSWKVGQPFPVSKIRGNGGIKIIWQNN